MADKTAPQPKLRSKWTRIAVEGATTDGRKIERSWIEDMAATYNPNTYGARLNCEHIRGLGPDSIFGAFGDVLALKAEEVDIAGDKKLALFAQIEPTAALIELNKKGQKVYTSIEVQPKFADTGKAYLVGLAVTDSPASLGTEALQFSAQHGTLATRKLHKDNLFSAAEETLMEFEEIHDAESKVTGLFTRVMDLLGKSKDKEGRDAAQFSELSSAIEAIADHAKDQASAFSTEQKARQALETRFSKLETQLADLITRLEGTEAHSQQKRPTVTGGDGAVLSDF